MAILFQLLQEVGFAPPLFATFNNGLVYQYIPGEVLTVETVCSPAVYPLIARKMAKLHKLCLHSSQSKPALWSKCEKFINLISEHYSPIEKQNRWATVTILRLLKLDKVQLRNNVEVKWTPQVPPSTRIEVLKWGEYTVFTCLWIVWHQVSDFYASFGGYIIVLVIFLSL